MRLEQTNAAAVTLAIGEVGEAGAEWVNHNLREHHPGHISGFNDKPDHLLSDIINYLHTQGKA